MPTVKIPARLPLSAQRRQVVRKIATIRGEVEDLLDSVESLEARAKDTGVRYSTDEVRAKLGLTPFKRRCSAAKRAALRVAEFRHDVAV